MKVLSVNVSLPKEIQIGGKALTTGIFKKPVKGRVKLSTLNLEGDGQADPTCHGGTDKAVYVYSIENYDYWEQELDRDDFTFGQFGENWTVNGMLENQVNIGDVFQVGEVLVEVTQPRIPCAKLGKKMEMPGFLKLFLSSCRVGFYLRVLEEGEVGAGDSIERVKEDPLQLTVRDVCHLLYFETDNLEGAKKALAVQALSLSWRKSFETRLKDSAITVKVDEKAAQRDIQ